MKTEPSEKSHHREVRIHLDQHPYQSPTPTTGRELYALGKVPENHQLYREVTGDEEDEPIFKDGEEIELYEDEHFHSSPDAFKGFKIIVNGRPKEVKQRVLTFMEVVALAFNPIPTGPNITFTITYRKAAGKKHEGNLLEGETVKIKNGTIFNVTATDKS